MVRYVSYSQSINTTIYCDTIQSPSWCPISCVHSYISGEVSVLSPVFILTLCPSLTVPNLLPNEHELTIQVCSGDHSWSFQSIPIHSNSVLLMRVGSAGEYESFEHVHKISCSQRE